MPSIAVVSDASICLKWFHAEGEEEVDAARRLPVLFGLRRIELSVLDLTVYEVGNALIRGRAAVPSDHAAITLDALADLCPVMVPTSDELRSAARLAIEHGLTLYDAAYAAVARSRGAELATLDTALLRTGLGRRPSAILSALGLDSPVATDEDLGRPEARDPGSA